MIVDWLPWNHTFGGNHNFNLVLAQRRLALHRRGQADARRDRGDRAQPARHRADDLFQRAQGLRDAAAASAADRRCAKNSSAGSRCCSTPAPSLSQHVLDALQALAIETTGERIIFLSSLGSTETAPLAIACSWDTERVGNIGLPAPGVELKLVPREGKLEARLKGPNITPGYWRAPALTADAFDEEGFYKIGDALKFADPAEPAKGLLFDGRLAEDFKLATGTWVSVGPLRAAFIAHCAPLARDVVFAGADRDEIAALVFPDLDACRKLAPDLAADAAAATVLADARIVAAFARLLEALAEPRRGTSARVCRAILLAEPPSLDIGETTDKGSINQRAVLARRAALVEELYADPPPASVIVAGRSGMAAAQGS